MVVGSTALLAVLAAQELDVHLGTVDAHQLAAPVGKAGGREQQSTEIVVLDDVTPRYAAASAALNSCRAELDRALRKLSESDNSV